MEIKIAVGGKHVVHAHSPDSTMEHLKVVDLGMNLSETNLFRDPLSCSGSPEGDHIFLPLNPQIRTAFRLVTLADDSSRLVRDLLRYQAERLPTLLAELASPVSVDYEKIKKALSVRREIDPDFGASLQRVIAEISRERPDFFDTEKFLGTSAWLESGGASGALSFQVQPASVRPDVEMDSPGRIHFIDARGSTVEFSVSDWTAYLASDQVPTSRSVLRALCEGGALGQEFASLNRAAGIARMIEPLRVEFNAHQAEYEKLNSHYRSPSAIAGMVVSAKMMAAGGGLATLGPAFMSAVSSGHVGIGSMALCGLFGGAFVRHLWNGVRVALVMRKDDQHRIGELERIFARGHKEYASVLSTVLLSFIDSRSSGSTQVTLGAEGGARWFAEFEGRKLPDTRILPHEEVVAGKFHWMAVQAPSVSLEVDRSPIDARSVRGREHQDLYRYVNQKLIELSHVERAHQEWNALQACHVIDRFLRVTGRDVSNHPAYTTLVPYSQRMISDDQGRFQAVDEALQVRLQQAGIRSHDWDVVSRALFAVDLLEQLSDSRAAQRIALMEIEKLAEL